MSAPYSGQSGTSGLIQFLTPVLPTSAPSPKGTVPAGSPGVGETGIADGQFYVNGAVTSAVLNGLDVVGPQYFGPNGADLVISGPNEGNNVGLLTPHSGTIGESTSAVPNQTTISLSID
jgi:5'-nucleotidase